MIRFLFCVHYHMHTLVCGAEDSGHDGTTRSRLYIILAHRLKTEKIGDPHSLYREVCKEIRRYVHTTPADYLIAPKSEIMQEIQDLVISRRRPGKVTVARLRYSWPVNNVKIFFRCFTLGILEVLIIKNSI